MKKTKTKLSESAKNKIIIFSLVGALLLGGIVIAIFAIIDYVKRDPNFDYLTSNLDRYVYLSEEDYKDYEMKLDIAKPRDIDVDVVMLGLLASNAKLPDSGDGAGYYTSNRVMGAGDHAFIYYRGYLKDKDGNTVEVSGMCNFQSANSQELTLGSGQFVPGFELGLIGKNIDEFPKFEKITSGKVTEDMIVYISFTRSPNESSSEEITVSNKRIDLADPTSLAALGENFKDHIVGSEIGIKKDISDVTLSGKTYTYKNFKVEFATTCEKASTNNGKVAPVIECYFPYDYGTDGTSAAKLRNENAYFEVYIEQMQDYTAPVLDDAFITELVKKDESPITEAELNEKYEGATIVDKYKAYVKDFLYEQYEDEYRSMVEDAMWEHYLAKAEFKKYPGVKVKPIYDDYVADVYYQFEETSGTIQDPTSTSGEYKTYENIDDFAVAYLNLTYSSNKDWRDVLYKMSESLVGERLIMYYLIDKLDIEITDELLEKTKADVKQEYLDEYIKQWIEYEKSQNKDYKTPEGEEYDKFVEEKKTELFNYYNDEYFTETAYYEIALDEFLKLPKVVTLDERSAYPYPTTK